MPYLARKIGKSINHAMLDTRVVILNGARQAGKSTILKALKQGRTDVLERRLDNPAELASARHDPESFVRHDGVMFIDEVQRAPELILPIKARVDEDNRAGQYLLTGSSRLLKLRMLPDVLVGRSETIELWPFSQGEVESEPDGFVDAVFAEPPQLTTRATELREDYIERALRGGFPEATKRSSGRREKFFESYAADLIDRDVSQLTDLSRRGDLNRLIRLAASRMACLLNISALASDSGIAATTLERYLALFEEVFLLKRIEAWTSSETSRALRMRKLLFVDSGLGAYLAGRSSAKVARDPTLSGQLLENFALSELARQLGWATEPVRLYHYRTRDGREVDAVLEANDGRIVGVEIKSSATVSADDFRHLEHLKRAVPTRFHFGVVLYTGTKILPFGPRMLAAPLDALWCSSSKP
jgi:uncharacterized protein